jgi:subfamily B ATP-binding cassette protein MsbA
MLFERLIEMNTYRRILQFAAPLYKFLPWYLVCVIFAVIFDKAMILLFAPILDVLFSNHVAELSSVTLNDFPEFTSLTTYFGELKNWSLAYITSGESKEDLLFKICMILLITSFLANTFNFIGSSVLAKLKGRIVRKVRTAVFNRLTSFELSYFSNERRGDIMSRMTNDVQEVEAIIIGSFHTLLKEPITIILTFSILFYISTSLVVFTFIVLPVVAILIALITKKLRNKSKMGQHYLGQILEMIDETLGGLRVIQAFTAEGYLKSKFEKLNRTYEKTLRSIDVSRSLAGPISQFFGMCVVLMILYYGGSLVLKNIGNGQELEPQMFVIFILMFAAVISPIKSLANAISSIQRGLIAGDRIFELMDADQKIKSKENAPKLNGFNDKLELKNISFSYGDHEVLSNISLTIPKGKSIALVGPSGGGKSTLMDLFPRFQDVNKGTVTLDGVDVKDCDLFSLRTLMGTVTQDSILFNDSVFNNIAFGIEATQEQVENAAKVANAHEFILNAENGYETQIGDRGMKLSGGQRQRLTIARAVLKNPDILLLDEATSALDSESERLVQEALNKLMDNRTSIVIAHRLSTIQHVDEIVVIEQGKIKERGTHAELIANEDVYFKLYNMQSFD